MKRARVQSYDQGETLQATETTQWLPFLGNKEIKKKDSLEETIFPPLQNNLNDINT
jgi:hypothetical protein